ncbi:hypothetical protein HUN01_06885 [Nostoc edaphicum CCNP1411]|uniref:Uncharacterized protein n=1 Tax=Nostoc edaphicum CCNP1411 TaxID=1472755 RepID=A0A7D7QI43_9NOSO|nr:hypothetical protein [Nostoc edaphicum]QMS87321.1 hypothetical protein HUN01_06885 [Nostoc edaphicum CCNP1411]
MKPVKHFIHIEEFCSYIKMRGIVVVRKNGQTQEIGRRLNSSNISDQRERLGKFQDSSSFNGIEQIRLDQANCPTKNTPGRTGKLGGSPAGKILERLKRIEYKHLSYLKAHQGLLESQLDNSKEEEETFRREVQELEEEIYNLVSSEGKSQPPSEDNHE